MEIVLRVDDSQLLHMVDRSPMVVWNSLASVHRARRFGSRLQLRRNFITASMKEGQSMEGWIGETCEGQTPQPVQVRVQVKTL